MDTDTGLGCRVLAGSLLVLWSSLAMAEAEDFVLGYLTGSQRKEGDLNYPRPGRTISGAISLAVEEVNKGPLAARGHRLTFRVAETYGDEEVSIRQTAQLWSWNVSAYIGPQETCVHEGRLAAALNLPMISYVAFFYLNSEDTDFDEIADTVLLALKSAGIRVPITRFWHVPYYYGFGENPFHRLVLDTYLDIRIYVILGYHYEHLGLILAMDELHLFDKGEYWVVGVDMEEYDPSLPDKYLKGLLKNKAEPSAARAFRSYLGVSATPPWGFTSFAAQVNKYTEKPPFNFTNAAGFRGISKIIRAEAAYLYDAVHVYARALIHVLDQGGDPRNGSLLTRAMRNQTYRSAMGYLVYMNENCDAEGNYTVLGLLEQSGKPGLYPVGMFLPQEAQTSLPRLQLYSQVQWVGGFLPVAEPVCGFRGEKCISHTTEIATSITGGVLLLLAIVALVFYRNWKYEQELDSLLWKVDFKEIQMQPSQQTHINGGNNNLKPNGQVQSSSSTSLLPFIRTSQVSLSSNPDADFRYSTIYSPIGVYRGRVFAVKRLPLRQFDITREMKKDLKMMRDLRHDNLNAFIGACTEAPDICIVSEYCTRGSLKDILDNEDVKLDNMFIASLIGDIIRGLIYLHESPVRLHGNLKSSNCLVDSRWVVKLSDFGNLLIKRGIPLETEETSFTTIPKNDARWQALLYRAPELLRRDNCRFQNGGGTQKGDIYSFGIVLYELHTRQGPFGDLCANNANVTNEKSQPEVRGQHKFTASELVAKVAYPAPGTDLCRPPLEPLDNGFDCVRECLADCWTELPEERPELKIVRARLRPLRKGMKPNIFDNMMAMMEKYANNLEVLVDERTDQLVEEKKKTDALLLEMLPRYVAEQLKRGHKVEAESFDSVTIYFSDIVGFTTMSAESTPLQVVDFLNDLYTCFDSTIENFDVYKVETIGDAYMVVSGLPVRNGIHHAAEIASMSLRLLEGVEKFCIRHRPGEDLRLRIGIHSGPVCAGVVGLKMPRYCLFGDTVNTASRMESTGLPLKIHCSAEFKVLLDTLGGYHLLERGSVRLKGKGERVTFWLLGEDVTIRRERDEARASRKPKNKTSDVASTVNGGLSQPRSSLKTKTSPGVANAGSMGVVVLPRCSSLESPKRLRFATGDKLLESIVDFSPSRRFLGPFLSNGSSPTIDAAISADLRPVSSCPTIDDYLKGRVLNTSYTTFRNSVPVLVRSRDVSETPLLLPNGRLPQL